MTKPNTVVGTAITSSTWAKDSDYTHQYSYDGGNAYFPDGKLSSSCRDKNLTTCSGAGTLDITDTAATQGNINAHYHVGNHYTWTAALAMNDSSTLSTTNYSNPATTSICPKGWRLPTAYGGSSSVTGEFKALNDAYGGITNSDATLLASPLFFVHSGYVNTGSLNNVGLADSGYWSSTVDSSIRAYYLYLLSTGVIPANGSGRYHGYSVRCIAQGEQHTITWNANGGSVSPSSITLEKGFTLSDYPTPTQSGYAFLGWYTSASGGTKIPDSITVSDDATYYAHWAPGVTITWNANEGSVSPSSSTVGSGSAIGTLPTPTRTGHSFDGWFTAASSGTQITESTVITDNVTYYAHWTINNYTITWNANSGSVSPGSTTKPYGSEIGTLPTPTRNNYEFQGWFTSSSGGTQITESTVITDNVTYYAHWQSSGGGTCVTGDTVFILADGTEKRIDEFTGDEELLVWDFENASYTTSPMIIFESEPEDSYPIIHVFFENGIDVETSYEHGFFDYTLGKFIYINEDNPEQYIGHEFFMKDGDSWKPVKLTDIKHETKTVELYSLATFKHLNFFNNGMMSIGGNGSGMYNYFDVDLNTMSWNQAKMQADIEKYGLLNYEDFDGMIDELAFEGYNCQYLGVSIGKGLITWEGIQALADRYEPQEAETAEGKSLPRRITLFENGLPGRKINTKIDFYIKEK